MFLAADNPVLATDVVGVITDTSITATVPNGTNVTALVPTIDYLGTSVSPDSGVACDFTDNCIYTVTAEDASTIEYTAQVIIEAATLASLKDITSFVFSAALNAALSVDVPGTIVGTNINVMVPPLTDRSALVPSVVHSGASINPASGVAADFSNSETVPVGYSVTAQDNSIQSYAVIVTVNQAPTVTFPAADIWISGAGDATVNGYYDDRSILENGRPSFDDQATGTLFLYAVSTDGTPTNYWVIHSAILGATAEAALLPLVFYHNNSDITYPPTAGWTEGGTGTAPAPTVREIPITGNISVVGSIMEAVYLYSDPDGHAEGATAFQWYSCTSVGDAGTIISGAESATYQTQPTDNNLWLKVEITPVDEHDGVGATVKSSASRQVGST